MYDFNEQQVSGDEPKSTDKAEKKPLSSSSADESTSCGGAPDDSWDSCGCGHGHGHSMTGSDSSSLDSTEFGFSRESQPAESETVFARHPDFQPASNIDAPQRDELWQALVASQRPAASSPAMTEVVARNPMQWTLVDLTSSACDKPGCDPESCDSEDCDTTDAYDRSEYEMPEYAGSGRGPAVTFAAEESEPAFAFREEPAPAPAAFVPAAAKVEAAKVEAKSKKAAEAKKAAKKPAAAKKATKVTAKKAAKKTTVKKAAAKKTVAKKGAKKTPATKAKKAAAAKTSLPLPTNPNFPRVQAA